MTGPEGTALAFAEAGFRVLGFDVNAAKAAALRPGQLVVLVRTTGDAPEREDPGNGRYGMGNTPKLVAGCTAVCRALTERLCQAVVETVVAVASPRVAAAAHGVRPGRGSGRPWLSRRRGICPARG